MARDLALRDAIAERPARPWSGTAFRAAWAGRDPLEGSFGGGRWAPRNGFEVLYASLEKDGAVAEVDAWLGEITPRPDRPVLVHELRVELTNSIAIETPDELAKLGVDTTRYQERHYARTQAIGDAANFLGFDGLFVPSARWPCLNLVLFLGNHHEAQRLDAVASAPVNWGRWRGRSGE